MKSAYRLVICCLTIIAACYSFATIRYQDNRQTWVGASLYYPATIKTSNTLSRSGSISVKVSYWQVLYSQPSTFSIELVSVSTNQVVNFVTLNPTSTEKTYTWNTNAPGVPFYVRLKATCMQTLGSNYTKTYNRTFEVSW